MRGLRSAAAQPAGIRELGHVPALDALRGIAIALVLVAHAGDQLPGGRLGVDLFFVLSGFLITSLLLTEWSRNGSFSLRRFYERRARRLLPALVVMLAVYLAVTSALLVADQIDPARWRASLLWSVFGLTYLVNVVQTFVGPPEAYEIGHLWTLAQEEQFYLLWPPILLLLLARNVSARTLMWGLAGLAVAVACYRAAVWASGASFFRGWASVDTHADPILIGCAFGVAFSFGLVRRVPPWMPLVLLVPATVALLGLGLPTKPLYSVGVPLFALASGAAILSVTIHPDSWGARLLDWRALRWLGAISYGLYLIHQPVFAAVGPKIGAPLSIALAAASLYLVEARFRKPRGVEWRIPSASSGEIMTLPDVSASSVTRTASAVNLLPAPPK
jgi:peptidoglycan/LPS O-acetylase OafA/YrhL